MKSFHLAKFGRIGDEIVIKERLNGHQEHQILT
jgi:hypothetical protein